MSLTDKNNYVRSGYIRLPNGKQILDSAKENPMATRYKSLLKNEASQFSDITIRQSKPELTETDYKKGVIKRYFIQKANDKDSPIYEISRRESSKYSRDNRYNLVVMDWVIAGGDTYKITGDISKTITPKEQNSLSISDAQKVIPNINLYLPNLLQYYKTKA